MRYQDFPSYLRAAIAASILLAGLPALFSLGRLWLITQGEMLQESDLRFIVSPWPIALHVAGVSGFLVLGALQLRSAGRKGTWHRRLGPPTAMLGLTGAISGVWMVFSYPPGPDASGLLNFGRLVFGTGMAAAILFACIAVRSGQQASHKAWMIRAFAIASAVGTQIFALAVTEFTYGSPSNQFYAILMIASWCLNLAVAEFIIARLRQNPPSRAISQRIYS